MIFILLGGDPPEWYTFDPSSMLADLLGFAGDLLRACGDLWGIPCGLAGGLLRLAGCLLREFPVL